MLKKSTQIIQHAAILHMDHTEDEIDGSKGAAFYPCHHEILKPDPKLTPCRIVFNSSANFKGDFLHDYCAKGPELLKNLLGVLI